LIKVQCW